MCISCTSYSPSYLHCLTESSWFWPVNKLWFKSLSCLSILGNERNPSYRSTHTQCNHHKFIHQNGATCVCVCVLESHRLSDSCAPLGMAAWMGCSASSWSLCRTLWSCCSRSRCWSGKDRSGLRALQTRTFLSRWWWLSGSPSSVLETPVKRPAENTLTLHKVSVEWGNIKKSPQKEKMRSATYLLA